MDGRRSEGSVARGWSRVVGVVAASGLLVAGLGVPGSAWAADASSCVVGSSTIAQCFPDANLAGGVADANDVGTGSTFTTAVVNGTTSLDLMNQGVKSLTGIGSLTNLTSLDLSYNKVSDVSPLKSLTHLTSLNLSGNGISDLSEVKGLSDLTNLTSLNLSYNKVSDVSPLKSLTNLTDLDLGSNYISDLSEVKGLSDLTNLTSLDLYGDKLDMYGNKISDLSPLKSLTQLTSLNLYGNEVSDLSPLKGLTQLTSLDLGGNKVSDVTPLKSLTQLTSLDLSWNDISDLSPLKSLTQLTSLDLSWNDISDLSPLKGLTQLTSLDLSLNKVSDVSPLKNLTNLTSLNLNENKISDVSPLKNLTNLTSLNLSGNGISDLSKVKGLSDLTQLTSLNLNENKISDVSPLKNLTNLTSLNLSGNGISDLSPLKGLTNLTSLSAYYAYGQSVSASAVVSGGTVSLPAAVSRSGSYASVTDTTPSGGRLDASTGRVTWSDASASSYSYTFDDGDGFSGTVTGEVVSFSDVSSSTPHAQDVAWLAGAGITTGWVGSDGSRTFRGMDTVKRQDMAAFLRREAVRQGVSEAATWKPGKADWAQFRDVTTKTPHAEDILWLAHEGITKGYSDGTFRGGDPVYRQDMAAFLRREAKLLGVSDASTWTPSESDWKRFSDVSTSTPHAEDIAWLASSGISEGWSESNGSRTFRGMNTVVRQDMAAFLHRLDELEK